MEHNSTNSADELVRIITLVRRLFQRMGSAWNGLHKDLGVSARMRAVMEALCESDKSVPEIAAEKDVTRQHIQTIVNELLNAGLAERIENPAHKRSSLISLTRWGKKVFGEIAERESKLFPAIAKELSHLQLGSAGDTLSELHEYFGSDAFGKLAEKSSRRGRNRRKK